LLQIKGDERLKSIPVIVYTTSKDVEESKELQELGAVHFISKPSDPDEIYYVVSFVLEEQLYLRKGR
jgi:response regulator RpfG family c-di-GMP phosphodiesterase